MHKILLFYCIGTSLTMQGMKREQEPIDHKALEKKHKCSNDAPMFLLVQALKESNVEKVRELLALYTDINAHIHEGKTALYIAAQGGNSTIIKMLLDAGASPNSSCITAQGKTGTPLFMAIYRKHTEIVDMFISAEAFIHVSDSSGVTPLMVASYSGSLEIVEKLLACDAPVNAQNEDGWTALMFAAQEGYKEIVHVLICANADVNAHSSNGLTALHLAVQESHTKVMKLLLNNGAELDRTYTNEEGMADITSLMDAVECGHKKMVTYLLEKGADINAQNACGDTPLMLAVEQGNKEIAELLIAQGADMDMQDIDGVTALHTAVHQEQTEILKLLLHNEANPHSGRNEVGEGETIIAQNVTPLMDASDRGYKEIVHTLITSGAYINEYDTRGYSALLYAAKGGYNEILLMLLKHQACFTLQDKGIVETRGNEWPLESKMLLKLCLMSGMQMYRNNSLSYIQQIIKECMLQGIYKRMCQCSSTQCFHQTVPMVLSIFGDKEGTETLLKVGLPLWYLNAQDADGRTALMYAIIFRNYDIAQLLMQAYERIAYQCYEALHREVDSVKQVQPKQELVKAERAINICDKQGKNALAYALEKNDKDMVLRLLQAGARPSIEIIEKIAALADKTILLQLILKGFIQPNYEYKVIF